MELTKERIQEMKDIMEKEYGKEYTWKEATEAAYNMQNLAHVLYDFMIEDMKRQKRLEENPKGFHLDGEGYTCAICGQSCSKENTWYDKYGVKCMACQKGVDRKQVPASIAKNRDNWYSSYDLQSCFNVRSSTIRKWVREGVLKPRTITNDDKKPHIQVFLIKDNKDTLPPKKLVESKTIKETKNGQDWFRVEPWYKFVDPFEYLKSYKIMKYMKYSDPPTGQKYDYKFEYTHQSKKSKQ